MKLILLSVILISSLAHAAETATNQSFVFKPEVGLDTLFLEAALQSREQAQGGFTQPVWKLGVKTSFATWVELHAVLGPSTLVNTPSWVTGVNTSTVSLLEANATIKAVFGDVSVGAIPIPWGIEAERRPLVLRFLSQKVPAVLL